jgi:uncharacterized protein YcbX
MMPMRVAGIWRYPVKSMAGERLAEAMLRPEGIPGDRLVQVYDGAGRMVTARRYPELLRHRAAMGPDGEPLVDGLPWNSVEIARAVQLIVGPGAQLRRSDGRGEFDILPLLVATDGAIALFGHDLRRLRPNILISGVEGLAERHWEEAWLRIGEAIIYLDSLRGRCVMTTIDPDTNAQDPRVLQSILERFGGRLCLNAQAERAGMIREGDPVTLELPEDDSRRRAGFGEDQRKRTDFTAQ